MHCRLQVNVTCEYERKKRSRIQVVLPQESDAESLGQVHRALELTRTEGPWVLTLIRLPVTPPSNGAMIAEDADLQGPRALSVRGRRLQVGGLCRPSSIRVTQTLCFVQYCRARTVISNN